MPVRSVTELMDRLTARGKPLGIRLDNATQFTSNHVDA
jgi:hypothetical protein